ncbi:ankyrin repeat-containing domain protein [Chaetomium fimeti]|uniref:Ankyrin repeat-containing domain protein n=1 Tax=Chaetomium fimeti TaxID=1854472 RepID=A0AAE0H5V0_9PEZI|nr:ankyrin repeat-containing domain protein [Chaetomium fimeti]
MASSSSSSSSHLLNGLPIELLTFVIDGLDRVGDIAALALTNRRLYSTANPHLYKRAAECDDARSVAWAANRGLVSTLRMALVAGVNPNHEFIECVPEDEWESVTATARDDAAAGRPKAPWAMWDFDNRPRSANLDEWPSSDPDPAIDSDHADTPGGSASTVAPSPQAPSASDQESVVSSEEDLSRRSDATPATEPSPTPTPHHHLTRRYYAIHLAARGGHDEILELLIRNGADVDVPSERFCACTPLYGLLNTLEGPKPDPDPPLWTPLHAAICHSHTSTAKLLLSHKASPYIQLSTNPIPDLRYGATALHHAAAMGLTTLVQHLITTKTVPDINTQDTYTLTPFYHAYAARQWDTTVPALLALGADIHCEAKMYIPYTAITPLGEACRLGDFDAADRLLALGADATHGFIAPAAGGCLTPLHMCCMRSAKRVSGGCGSGGGAAGAGGAGGAGGDSGEDDDEVRGRARMRTIAALIEKGAALDAQDCFGDTPLSAAEKARNTFALEALARLSIAGVGEGEEKAAERGGVAGNEAVVKKPAGGGVSDPEPAVGTAAAGL